MQLKQRCVTSRSCKRVEQYQICLRSLLAAGAIGTAVFGGVLLRDVLQQAGLDEDETDAQHIQFEGLDAEPGGQCYGASIPLDKAVQRSGDVLLAYEMNGRCALRHSGCQELTSKVAACVSAALPFPWSLWAPGGAALRGCTAGVRDEWEVCTQAFWLC